MLNERRVSFMSTVEIGHTGRLCNITFMQLFVESIKWRQQIKVCLCICGNMPEMYLGVQKVYTNALASAIENKDTK